MTWVCVYIYIHIYSFPEYGYIGFRASGPGLRLPRYAYRRYIGFTVILICGYTGYIGFRVTIIWGLRFKAITIIRVMPGSDYKPPPPKQVRNRINGWPLIKFGKSCMGGPGQSRSLGL